MLAFEWLFEDDTIVYRWFAYIGTTLFVLKMLLTLIAGSIGGDAEFDAGGDLDVDGIDIEHDSGSSFTVFSLQGLLAFLMAMGWMGLACSEEWGLGPGLTLLISTAFGASLMVLNGFLMYQARRLNAAGKYDVKTAVGKVGRVYLTIPEKGKGTGEVEVIVSGQRKIVRAVSNGPTIPSFTDVRVLRMRDGDTVIVQDEEAYQQDQRAGGAAAAT